MRRNGSEAPRSGAGPGSRPGHSERSAGSTDAGPGPPRRRPVPDEPGRPRGPRRRNPRGLRLPHGGRRRRAEQGPRGPAAETRPFRVCLRPAAGAAPGLRRTARAGPVRSLAAVGAHPAGRPPGRAERPGRRRPPGRAGLPQHRDAHRARPPRAARSLGGPATGAAYRRRRRLPPAEGRFVYVRVPDRRPRRAAGAVPADPRAHPRPGPRPPGQQRVRTPPGQ